MKHRTAHGIEMTTTHAVVPSSYINLPCTVSLWRCLLLSWAPASLDIGHNLAYFLSSSIRTPGVRAIVLSACAGPSAPITSRSLSLAVLLRCTSEPSGIRRRRAADPATDRLLRSFPGVQSQTLPRQGPRDLQHNVGTRLVYQRPGDLQHTVANTDSTSDLPG